MEPLELPPATFVESPHTGQSSQLLSQANTEILTILRGHNSWNTMYNSFQES